MEVFYCALSVSCHLLNCNFWSFGSNKDNAEMVICFFHRNTKNALDVFCSSMAGIIKKMINLIGNMILFDCYT